MLTNNERKELIKMYPFLYPRWLNGKKLENYDYEFHDLDKLPDGWLKSWVPEFLDKVNRIIINKNIQDDYFITRLDHYLWHRFNYKANIDVPEIEELVKEYSKTLDNYCMFCGKTPCYKSTWGFYACDECAKKDFYETQEISDDKLKWEDEFIELS